MTSRDIRNSPAYLESPYCTKCSRYVLVDDYDHDLEACVWCVMDLAENGAA